MDLKDLLDKYDIEELNTAFMEYFAVIVAKSLKDDEVVEAIDENGCNLAKIKKILGAGLNDIDS